MKTKTNWQRLQYLCSVSQPFTYAFWFFVLCMRVDRTQRYNKGLTFKVDSRSNCFIKFRYKINDRSRLNGGPAVDRNRLRDGRRRARYLMKKHANCKYFVLLVNKMSWWASRGWRGEVNPHPFLYCVLDPILSDWDLYHKHKPQSPYQFLFYQNNLYLI